MTGMLHAVAMAPMPPVVLAELKRLINLARRCPVCGHDPVLVVRHGIPSVMSSHPPECRERPQLTVISGGVS